MAALDEARRIIREDICNVAGEDGPPANIGARTRAALESLAERRVEHVLVLSLPSFEKQTIIRVMNVISLTCRAARDSP